LTYIRHDVTFATKAEREVSIPSYGIGGNCMDEITLTVLWHDRWIARERNKSTTRARLLIGRTVWNV